MVFKEKDHLIANYYQECDAGAKAIDLKGANFKNQGNFSDTRLKNKS